MLDCLTAEGIIELRQLADCAVPIVPLFKEDQTVCIFVDFKKTGVLSLTDTQFLKSKTYLQG